MQTGAYGRQDIRQIRAWNAWDEFLESKTTTGFRQSSWYTAFKSASGWEHFGTVFKDGANIVGGAMVLKRQFSPKWCYYYIPDGPVFSDGDSESEREQIFNAVLQFVDQKRQSEPQSVSHLCINPRWQGVPSFVKGFRESEHYYGSPRDTQCIDLTQSEDDMLRQMKPKGRYNIGVAHRHGVSVVEDTSAQGIESFLELYEETFSRKHRTALSRRYFQKLIPLLSAPERGSIFFAEYRGERLATALVTYFGRTATYYHGGSRAVHRNVMAPYLLHFAIMRNAKSRGCHCYDLFGVTPQDEPSDGWSDISAFKRKFGGRELRLTPTLELIYNPVGYQEWKNLEEI
ncbi:lipid II:glycine glycyltransferase FemX [Methylobacterium nigriterrae]|uniref:lipid II:glycine glycyltransferase FemX n=1 Tax=Methylobacterium nigriterrae TaxID=3127512 RepID=UPI0030139A5E